MNQAPTFEALKRMSPVELELTGHRLHDDCEVMLGELDWHLDDIPTVEQLGAAWVALKTALDSLKASGVYQKSLARTWPDGTIRRGRSPGECDAD